MAAIDPASDAALARSQPRSKRPRRRPGARAQERSDADLEDSEAASPSPSDGVTGAKHTLEVLLRRRHQRGYVEVDTSEWKLLELEAEAEARLRRIRHQLGRTRELSRRISAANDQLPLWAGAIGA